LIEELGFRVKKALVDKSLVFGLGLADGFGYIRTDRLRKSYPEAMPVPQ
jgi:hypothetical protein